MEVTDENGSLARRSNGSAGVAKERRKSSKRAQTRGGKEEMNGKRNEVSNGALK